MKILIAGDLVPTKKNEERFESACLIDEFKEDFLNIWKKSDFRIFNLECALGESINKIDKNGPNLQASSKTIKGIKSLDPSLILLSNNHILDYRIEGLENTITLLEQHNIPYTGIIENSKQENKTYYIKKDGVKVGIYNLCENEFSLATSSSKGANSFYGVKNYLEIKRAKEECDYLIVIFHAGKEFYRYPSPDLQQNCRNFIDFGADVVITQHSHCIGTEEEYNNGKILYGQGNFIFDNGIEDEYWNTALLVEIDITNDQLMMNYIPIEKDNGLIKISNNQTIMQQFYKRKEQIKLDTFVNEQYKKFAKGFLNSYLGVINRITLIKRIKNKLSKRKYYLSKYKKEDLLAILNIIECEAHRELFIRGLKERIKDVSKIK